jgi:hypothetical protein
LLFFSRPVVAALLLGLVALQAFPSEAAPPAQASMSLDKLGVRGYNKGLLVATLKTKTCRLREPENANYLELLIPEGEFDCGPSDLKFEVFGEPGAILVPQSVRVEAQVGKDGRLARFMARGKVSRDDGSNVQPFELAIIATIIEKPLEYMPVRAYVQPGSMSVSAVADLSEYSFKVVYEVSKDSDQISFLLNKEMIETDSGKSQSGEFKPFNDKFLGRTTKVYPVTVPLRGAATLRPNRALSERLHRRGRPRAGLSRSPTRWSFRPRRFSTSPSLSSAGDRRPRLSRGFGLAHQDAECPAGKGVGGSGRARPRRSKPRSPRGGRRSRSSRAAAPIPRRPGAIRL